MDSSYTAIKNYETLVNYLDEWPSFHDFEVVSILLKRSNNERDKWSWSSIKVKFLGFRGDVALESPERRNCYITLRFGGLENLMLNGFNHQNAINGLVIKKIWLERLKRDMFAVEIIQGFGVGATFDCAQMELISITPSKKGIS